MKTTVSILFSIFFFAGTFPYLYCTASKTASGLNTSHNKSSNWTRHHPVSSTDFIGIGSAKISDNIELMQKTAKQHALEDIASQITVTVAGTTIVEETDIVDNQKHSNSAKLSEKIVSYTSAILKGVSILETTEIDGYYWVKMVLSKKDYYDEINKKVNNARTIAINHLLAAEKALPIEKIKELSKALEFIEGFSNELLRCNLGGQEIILNTEIYRLLQKTLNEIKITSTIDKLEIGASDSIPDSLGFSVSFNNNPFQNCPLIFSASNSDLEILTLPQTAEGFYPIKISSLTPSSGYVTIKASLNTKLFKSKILKKGFRFPEGKFIISRKTPSLHISGKSCSFINNLVDEMVTINMFSKTPDNDSADYSIKGAFLIDPEITTQRSIFQAKGTINCSLSRLNNQPHVEIHKTISAGSGKSAEHAIESLKKEAVRVAIGELKKVF